MKPFDDKSREMDYKIRGLWILLLVSFILYALPWLAFSDRILGKFADECVAGVLSYGCVVPAGAIAAFIAIQIAIIVLIFKIGARAQEFMRHYRKSAKGKANGTKGKARKGR
jgi:hypothetical protein